MTRPVRKRFTSLNPQERAAFIIHMAAQDEARERMVMERRANRQRFEAERNERNKSLAKLAEERLARLVAQQDKTPPRGAISGAGKVTGGLAKMPLEASTLRPLTPFERMTGRRERQVVAE